MEISHISGRLKIYLIIQSVKMKRISPRISCVGGGVVEVPRPPHPKTINSLYVRVSAAAAAHLMT